MSLKLGTIFALVVILGWTSVNACGCCGCGCGCCCCRVCQYCCPQPPIIIQPPPALHNVCHVPCCCCRPCCCCGCGGRRKRSDPLERRRITKMQRLCRDLNNCSNKIATTEKPLRAKRVAKTKKVKAGASSGAECKC